MLVSIKDIREAGCGINRSWFLTYCRPEKTVSRHFGMENLYCPYKVREVAKKRREEVLRNNNLATGRKNEALKNIDIVERAIEKILSRQKATA